METIAGFMISPDLHERIARRAAEREESHLREVRSRTDLLFSLLMPLQWIGVVLLALRHDASPGAPTSGNDHLPWVAPTLGGFFTIVSITGVLLARGRSFNQYAIAVAQLLTAGVAVHLSAGRLGTPYHLFGALAFLSLYREWKVLATATLTIVVYPLLPGVRGQASMFAASPGLSDGWLELSIWVLFTDAVLLIAGVHSRREMTRLAVKWATLSIWLDFVKGEVRRQNSANERRQQELVESEYRLRRIIEVRKSALITVDLLGRIVEWSPTAERLLGWKEREALGRRCGELLRDSGMTQVIARFIDARGTSSGDLFLESDVVTRDGRHLEVEVLALELNRNDELQFQIVFHDVTERRAMQSRLMHSRKLEAVGQLAAGIAHEINTPTQFVGDNLRFLQESFISLGPLLEVLSNEEDGAGDRSSDVFARSVRRAANGADVPYLREELPRAIAESLEGIDRIGGITRAMKEFSHPGSVGTTRLDLAHAIDNTLIVCRNEWKYVADVRTDFDPSLPPVECLEGKLSQAVLNIVVNAAQAIAEVADRYPNRKGEIVITTKNDDGWAEIRISDNGPGIPADVRSRIFDPFFTTKEIGKGTGQGLAIAHAVIVEMHGGSIDVASQMGRGTTFVLRLPIDSEEQTLQEPTYEEERLVR